MTGAINPLTSYMAGNQTSSKLNDEIESTSLTSELHKVTIPTLILWGEYDFVVPPSLGYDTYNHISSSVKKIVTYPKSGHSPMNNEWVPFNQAVIEFVDQNK
ncbi:alpha/beta hydrolase [bacterium SCSIO 12741]|nr:alpha/beta hydrolase [bacterium SCSIO 12741]